MLYVVFSASGWGFEFPHDVFDFEVGGFAVGSGDDVNVGLEIGGENFGGGEFTIAGEGFDVGWQKNLGCKMLHEL